MNSLIPIAERPVACTIVARNYLAQARAFARSFQKHHPGGTVYVLLVDRIDGAFDPAKEPFITIPVEELGIPDFPVWAFKYSILELSTAVKPFLLRFLLTTKGHDHVMYFDPDILCYAPMTPIFDALEKNAIVLIPHLTDPLPEDGFLPRQIDILRSGAYNLGFLAIRKTPLVLNMLEWWHERLKLFCYVRLAEGLFVDQRWMDLVPGLFPDMCVLTDHGCDVAYWNVHCRIFEKRDRSYVVDGVPLRFFHFSGYDPREPNSFSKHQTRVRLKDMPIIQELCHNYGDRLRQEGMEEMRPLKYAFGFFDDGTPVPHAARKLYEDPSLQKLFPNPFQTGPDSFFEFLREPMEYIDEQTALSRLHFVLRDIDPELQSLFPSIWGASALPYAVHLLFSRKLPEPFLQSLQSLRAPKDESTRKALPSLLQRRHYWQSYQRLCRLGRKILGEKTFTRARNVLRRSKRKFLKETGLLPSVGLGINLVGYLAAESGLGEAVRGNVLALDVAHVPLALRNFDRTYARKGVRTLLPRATNWNPYRFNLIHVNADQFRLCTEHLGPDFFRNRFTIGYWVWETSPFPKEWMKHFAGVQEVWTASTYTQKILQESAPISVQVMPHVVQVSTTRQKMRKDLGIPEGRFVFLFVFDFHSIFERKNPLGIVRAFEKAFPSNSKTTLVIKSMHSGAYPKEWEMLENALQRIGGIHIHSVLSRDETHDLIACADAYVSLHRSEGFGLTLAEAMLLGKPVIASAYGGNTDFMNAENSVLVPAHPITIEKDYEPYKAGGTWADPDLDEAANAMRRLVTDPVLAQRIGEAGKRTVEERLSPQAVGDRMRKRLEFLAKFYC